MHILKIDNNLVTKINSYKDNSIPKTAELLILADYDEQLPNDFNIDYAVLEDAKKFNYVKYESFENFDCFSLKLIDFEKLNITKGQVVMYIQKGNCIFFTNQVDLVQERLQELFQFLGEKVTLSRIVYTLFHMQNKNIPDTSDKIEKEIMDLENTLIASNSNDCVREIIYFRNQLMILKRYYEQSLYALDLIEENENNFFDYSTLKSFKILTQRTERGFQNILNIRESLTQVRESYEAEVDISLNTTMKFFTVITTIFLPLTLIVGWYGMNLKMPEYEYDYAYIILIVLSVLFISGSFLFFKNKKWF